MATTCIITSGGNAISVHPNYYTKQRGQHPPEHWCFRVNVERRKAKEAQPLIRYNAEIVAQRIEYSHPNTKIDEEIVIYRSNRGGIGVVNQAYTLLQSLLQAIDNGEPVWDVRELL